MKLQHKTRVAAAALLCLGVTGSVQALSINLINTGGVEQGSNAYLGFAAAAWYWEQVLTDNVTLNLQVGFGPLSGTVLGQASSSSSLKAQTAWRSALTADASTTLDNIAVSHLAAFSANNVRLNTSVQKSLGLYTGTASAIDGSITFSSTRPWDFDTRNGFQDVSSDFLSVAIHEIGHVLGFTSGVAANSSNSSTPTNTDMFRYQDGALDFSWGGSPYFSIDGGASQVFGRSAFASGADGFQTSHWQEGLRIHDGASCTSLVESQIGIMDPTGGLCQMGIVTAQDLALFDAIGWDLAYDILQHPAYAMGTSQILQAYLNGALPPVPEPGTWALLLAGLGVVGAGARRRQPATAAG